MSGNKIISLLIIALIYIIPTSGNTKEIPEIAVFIPQDNSYIQAFNIFEKETKKLHNYKFLINPSKDFKKLITVGSKNTINFLTRTKSFDTLFFFLVIDPIIYQEIKHKNLAYKLSGIFFYPSPKKQLEILKDLFPYLKNIAIICSKRSKSLAEYIKLLANNLKININIYEINLLDFPNFLQRILQENDILWMIPDQKIYTPITIKQTIVSAVKMGKPIWTFSPILLKAGAFGSFKIEINDYCKEAAKAFDNCIFYKDCTTTFTKDFKIILNKNLVDFWGIKIPKNLKNKIITE